MARRQLTEFAKWVGFNPAPHHQLLIDELEDLTDGKNDVLLVEMPPGSAKSTYVNMLFPAWYLAQKPDANVLSASHGSELAERWGRRTRNLIAAEALTLGFELSADSTSAGRWGTNKGGEYYAVGVGVGIMGFRADLGIIDDPFGSREDAESKRIRDARWEWYTNDFSSRLKPGAKRVIMHQRWHEDDLAGRVIKQLDAIGKPYRRLKIRAEALLGDPLGRQPGEFLWDDPDGYNYGQFLRDRKAELAGDPRTWSALYQQEPTPDTGDYFSREWLHPTPNMPAKESLRIYGASDYAVTAAGGDYTVHVVVGIDSDKRLYLLDMWRGQAASDTWVEALCDLVRKWRPLMWAEETGQIRAGVGPFLTRRMQEREAYVARKQFPTRGDKAVRAQSIRGRMAMVGLYVPERAPWRAELENELLRFPAGVHDDQCVVEGTLITMADGSLTPIEHVAVGDEVATPDGPCRVLAAKITNEAASVIRVTLNDGATLTGTDNHPVMVIGRGFVRLDALSISDKIEMGSVRCVAAHPRAKWSNIGGIGIADTLPASTLPISATSTAPNRGAGSFIGTCGRMLTALYRRVTTSTTATRTGQTTSSTISNASRSRNIGVGTGSPARSFFRCLNGPVLLPLNGIAALPALNGTGSTVLSHGKGASVSPEFARAAAAHFRQRFSEPNSVLVAASSGELGAAYQNVGDMSPMAKRSLASAAGENSSPSGRTPQPIVRKHVGCVSGIEALSVPARVRNLTVERSHVYYANGFLTHNCDALGLVGQLLDTITAPAPPKAETPAKTSGYASTRSAATGSWRV